MTTCRLLCVFFNRPSYQLLKFHFNEILRYSYSSNVAKKEGELPSFDDKETKNEVNELSKKVRKTNPDVQKKLNDLLINLTSKKNSDVDDGMSSITLAKPSKKVGRNLKPVDTKGLDVPLVDAVRSVAATKTNYESARRTESALLRQLRRVAKETMMAKLESEVAGAEKINQQSNMESLFESIKVTEESDIEGSNMLFRPKSQQLSQTREKFERKHSDMTADQIAFLETRRKLRRKQRLREDSSIYKPIDLFGSELPLGIFSVNSEEATNLSVPELHTWNRCQEREMAILSTPAPRNFLEEMIFMTEKGILWEFPIDNEQGIDIEKADPFHRHVFLESHLSPWCPASGPVRNFMELVCVGLSKNAFMSVEKKLDHIAWFRDYFNNEDKREIIETHETDDFI